MHGHGASAEARHPRQVRRAGVDVLVDLCGHAGTLDVLELFALRPAPLQAAYMGFCGTLGADYMQYMFADAIVVPPEQRCYYDEKIVSLPHSYFVNDYAQSCQCVPFSRAPARRRAVAPVVV